ncbi:LysR family transcriptional regulator [Alkalihalobacillus sp. TS-13]|uniref:LysR family transcriptional regulator n=1 Tax=Alkalihalobacillus sp. TS-13 TaxID=2842455 RepID=UPI001C880C8F|nr:LysR family transcriptional regulator [Alkalihalobacillus sp. TS-13]
MSIQRYEVFNKVVQMRNITKAGHQLGLTQSGVSHALKSFEEELGIPLLIRNRTGLQLTNEGKRVYEYTLRIMQTHNNLLQEVQTLKGLKTGTIKVGSFASVTSQWIPKILTIFSEKYPGITVEIYEDDYKSLEKAVSTGELDICFTTDSDNKSIEFIPLIKDKLHCIVSNKNPLSNQKVMKAKDIEKYPLIKPKKGWDNEVEDFFNQNQIVPTVKYEVSDDQSILSLVQANIGINIRPELVLKNAPSSITLLDFEQEAYRIIGLGMNEQKSPATSIFISTVTDLYQAI